MHAILKHVSGIVILGTASSVAVAERPPAGSPPAGSQGIGASSHEPARNTSSIPLSLKPRRRSVVHHYPYPYPEHYQGDRSAGFRNSGVLSRYPEVARPGEQYPIGNDPVRVARFAQGGGAPDRAEQLEAQRIGIQRENAIMNHIDNYSRPYLGYGVGYFGGFY
ncbi:MAG: hypothetical protein NVSMB9_26830 [Isosphaeraceae bacterium]